MQSRPAAVAAVAGQWMVASDRFLVVSCARFIEARGSGASVPCSSHVELREALGLRLRPITLALMQFPIVKIRNGIAGPSVR